MSRRNMVSAGIAIGIGAFVVAPATAQQDVLQESASLFVSVGQHPEAVDAAEVSAELDRIAASAPSDPYVLRMVALTRLSVADSSETEDTREQMSVDALAEFDRAVELAGPDAPARRVDVNGQTLDIDFSDAPEVRALLQAAVDETH
ncbi:MAG: hypothetical protein B7Y90_18970 [Alphaproteobacteria bacterium 32-64-14]|nr:MAG: hypothetical protein B7Y90_18970 [Alphaproteobacteria bacterium 32-64-14]